MSEVVTGGSREENEIDQLGEWTDVFVDENNDSVIKKTDE